MTWEDLTLCLQLYVRSSDVDRALTSAYSNLAGMYPPEPQSVQGQTVYSWQPIPVHTRLYDADFVSFCSFFSNYALLY